ncbi:MAG: response regulator [Cyanobacteria bacterium J06621_8]
MSNPILVVEDNDDLLLLFKLTLESAGYQVKTASSGREALNCLILTQPRLILMDIMMPKVSGLQISRTIKEQPDYQSLPIILVSAIDRLKNEQLSKSKANDIIYKPFDIDCLLSKVAELVS